MYIIVGLGNPTKEYRNTRHNIGFDVIDTIAKENNIDVNTGRCRALTGKGIIAGQKVILAKPLTYMNLSGESVRELTRYYKISVEDELIVIFDDVSLDAGQLRIRKRGSAGGHNGIKNIIANLNTQEFKRIKVGVGEKPKSYDLADYVLGHFTAEERRIMDESVRRAGKAAEMMICGGTDQAMNLYNKKSERQGDS